VAQTLRATITTGRAKDLGHARLPLTYKVQGGGSSSLISALKSLRGPGSTPTLSDQVC